MTNRNSLCLLLSLCLQYAATPTLADEIQELQPDRFALRAETLSPQQRQEIYLQLIENFVGWAEHSGRFVDSDELEPGGRCFDAAGRGVTWARGNSNLCLAYALLLEECPRRQRFSIYDVSRSRLEDHLRRTIRTLCLSNKNCPRHKATRHAWGGPSWQAALELIGCAWAAHLRQEHLDLDTLRLVGEVVPKEADNLDKKIPSRRFNDTGAEDCCWNAPLLALAANKYADDPRASRWDALCRKWAFNGASIDSDATSTQIIDGRPLEDWIVSENLHPDLTLDNHGMWSVGYQCAQQHFGEGALAYRVFDRPVPAALAHHADQMWRTVTAVLYLWDGDILFPHGQDWSWKVYSSIEYLCWQHCCRQNGAAGALESRALQMIYRRQLALGTGDLGAAVSSQLDFGNQTVKPKRWAFCYLMHKHFPAPESISFAEAAKAALGVHVYPFTKVAIHRTPEKCVSVSWHPRHQPIYILPEGDTTFTEPPFFFPYDRESGCARVTILPKRFRATSKHDNPRYPDEPRNAQIREIEFLDAGDESRTEAKLTATALQEVAATHDGNGMRVSYRKPWPGGVAQYVTLLSLPDEATVYFTAFRAERDALVTIGPLFPLRAAAPPGFQRPVRQYRGLRWLNMSDHVGFVSVDPLPPAIPKDRFFLTEQKSFQVEHGEWFGRAVLVVFARHSHAQTAESAQTVRLLDDSPPGKIKMTLGTSSGTTVLDVDFIRPAK